MLGHIYNEVLMHLAKRSTTAGMEEVGAFSGGRPQRFLDLFLFAEKTSLESHSATAMLCDTCSPYPLWACFLS